MWDEGEKGNKAIIIAIPFIPGVAQSCRSIEVETVWMVGTTGGDGAVAQAQGLFENKRSALIKCVLGR